LCIYNTKKYDTKLNRWTGRSDGLGIETQTLNLSSEIRNLNLNDKYLNEICKRFVIKLDIREEKSGNINMKIRVKKKNSPNPKTWSLINLRFLLGIFFF